MDKAVSIREKLERARSLNDEVEELRYAKEEAMDTATSMCISRGERVQTTSGNGTENKFISYAYYSRLLDERIAELSGYRAKILLLINKVSDTTLRTLLIARYINCKTWEQIAEDMHYSDKWVRTSLHKRALSEAEKACG